MAQQYSLPLIEQIEERDRTDAEIARDAEAAKQIIRNRILAMKYRLNEAGHQDHTATYSLGVMLAKIAMFWGPVTKTLEELACDRDVCISTDNLDSRKKTVRRALEMLWEDSLIEYEIVRPDGRRGRGAKSTVVIHLQRELIESETPLPPIRKREISGAIKRDIGRDIHTDIDRDIRTDIDGTLTGTLTGHLQNTPSFSSIPKDSIPSPPKEGKEKVVFEFQQTRVPVESLVGRARQLWQRLGKPAGNPRKLWLTVAAVEAGDLPASVIAMAADEIANRIKRQLPVNSPIGLFHHHVLRLSGLHGADLESIFARLRIDGDIPPLGNAPSSPDVAYTIPSFKRAPPGGPVSERATAHAKYDVMAELSKILKNSEVTHER